VLDYSWKCSPSEERFGLNYSCYLPKFSFSSTICTCTYYGESNTAHHQSFNYLLHLHLGVKLRRSPVPLMYLLL